MEAMSKISKIVHNKTVTQALLIGNGNSKQANLKCTIRNRTKV